jgi:hypothetical protein|tara:strand:- start:1101 stop:1259 length:159 start_codon:yes stop_codon:yes gene_type:complete
MKSLSVLKQIYKYAVARKKYWLLPFAVILVSLAVILVASQGSVVAPFIYTLF